MKSRLQKKRYCFLGVTLGALITACAGNPDRWVGSVDAVFRYRNADHSTVIHEVRPGSYSEQSGLKRDDIVLAVDGEDVTTAGYENLRARLRGPVGTWAKLTVQRGEKIIDLKIERRPISDKQPITNNENKSPTENKTGGSN